MPERSRIAGEWIAPALTITSCRGDLLAVAGAHADGRVPSRSDAIDEHVAAHREVRHAARAGSRYASFVDTRRPSRTVSAIRLTPVASGAW